jgi:hypothetical protein
MMSSIPGQPPLRLACGPEPPGQAHLAEACKPFADLNSARSGGNGERHAQVRAGLVDPYAAGHVDEDVGLPERNSRMAAEDGDDHGKALRIDSGGDPPRHSEVARRDERLDLEE